MSSEDAIDRRQRTCTECGYVTKTHGEFHPYLYCLLVKTGQAGGSITPEDALRSYGFVRADRYGITEATT